MQKVIQQEITKIQLLAKSEMVWQPDQPWPQKFHTFQGGEWSPLSATESTTHQRVTELMCASWNIDFMLPYADSRMQQAIKCLREVVSQQSATTASIIFLQESLQSDLTLLSSMPWIQDTFYISDLNTANWSSGYYGTVTLVDKRLRIKDSFRVHYSQTRMERDAFFTDIQLDAQGEVIRFCNTHLESLRVDPPRRPHQARLCAEYMKSDGVHGAVMAGDFNAIEDFDRSLHIDNGLQDAYLELGGKEDSDDGYTWGQQAPTYQREMFGCCRMDKVFFNGKLKLKSFERFGADIEVNDEEEKQHLISLGFERPWITDHLGVMARFEVTVDA